MENKIYRIDFTPLDGYFFSDQRRYRLRRKKKDGTIGKWRMSMDYFQRSRKYPQQTTILGALRYILLQEIGQIPITDKIEAEKAIGESSFIYQKDIQDFRSIKKVSRVLLNDGNELFEMDNMSKNANVVSTGFFSHDGKPVYIDQNYNEKISSLKIISSVASDKSYPENEIFKEFTKVGIRKNKREGIEDTLYKQVGYKIKPGWSFAVFAEVEHAISDKVIPMGAEAYQWKVKFTEVSNDASDSFLSTEEYDEKSECIEILSDTIVDYSPEGVLYSIAESIPFRNIVAQVVETKKNKHYYSSKPYNSDRKPKEKSDFRLMRETKMLIKKGSVFWFEDDKSAIAFSEQINKEKNMRNIGYNYFRTTNQKLSK